MCMVSNVGDEWRDGFLKMTPNYNPSLPINVQISRQEFDDLKKEVSELKKLMEAAKEFDRNTGQPDCEVDEKVGLIKKLAEELGVDLGEVI